MLEYEERLLWFVGPLDTFVVGARCKDLGAHMGAIHVHVFRERFMLTAPRHLFDVSL